MNINNRLLISIIFLAFTIFLIGVVGLISDNRNLDILISSGGGLVILTGTYLLVKNGEFIKSREYRISRIGISFMLIGIMFKVMHWNYSALLLGVGCMSFVIIYAIYIIRHINIVNWTNWLKLLFLLFFFLGRYFQWVHLRYSDELSILALITMIILIAEYVLRNRKMIKNKIGKHNTPGRLQ